MKRIIALLMSLILAMILGGCLGYIRVPSPVVMEGDMSLYYDDPVRGWYIEGYWTPDGIWAAPFWTIDMIILHNHFSYYHGHHRHYLEGHFARHPEKYRGGHRFERQPQHQTPRQTPKYSPPRQQTPRQTPKYSPPRHQTPRQTPKYSPRKKN